QAMRRYKEAPQWWYAVLLALAFFAGESAGLIAVLRGETTLPWWSYIVALAVGIFITPFSTLLYGRMGSAVSTNQLSKMVAGAVNPGRPVANLYFSMWSHDVVSTSIGLAQDLKLGQYTKIPPRVMFLIQLYGTILGAIINYVVMASVVTAQRSILLNPSGTNIWSGQTVQALNSNAVTWALAKDLYGPSGQYFLIPMAIFIGAIPTLIQWLISLRWPNLHVGLVDIGSVILPLYSAYTYAGVTSVYTSMIITGLLSQLWWRRYYPRSYRKYNYILGGAMDGGAQIMIFILSFAVFGAAGVDRPFP
ncbi:OPT oligopeptide transporter protein-domain-containing protein, partial [Vararia minispora EC-137]